MKLEFPKLYTDLAKYYDRLESQYRDYQSETEWLKKIIDQHGIRRIIDISCGTGNHLSGLVSGGSIREFTAADASIQMIKLAKEKLRGQNGYFTQADFLSLPFNHESFDAAICMYWSIAGLNEQLVKDLFHEAARILKKNGVFVFDTENAEGIKEDLLDTPYIDSYFPDYDGVVVRANFSAMVEPALVDWHAYYLIEHSGVSELVNDRMNLRFYGRRQLEDLLEETGFRVLEVLSGPSKKYEKKSPSLYFITEKE